jgi:hypothetical protein
LANEARHLPLQGSAILMVNNLSIFRLTEG